MSSKIIIIASVILLITSFSILFVVEALNHDYDYKKAWSAVYFEDPGDASLDFAVENHEGVKSVYSYKVSSGDRELIEDQVEIEAGAKQKISPVLGGEKIGGSRVTITVGYKDMRYKIYKNIP